MKRKILCVLFFLFLFAPSSYGLDWERLTNSDLQRWADTIEAELNKISGDVSPSERNGYYWYVHGSMKISAGWIRQRFILHGQHQLEQSLAACEGMFAGDEDKANTCVDNIKRLIDGPPFK